MLLMGDVLMDKLTRRFIAGLSFLCVGNMWVVGGFITIKEAAEVPMFLIGLWISITGAWMVWKGRPVEA